MDTLSLKKYIFEEGKIEYVLQEIGCHHIKYHASKDYYTCANYNGDNSVAIDVYNNPYLNVVNWTRTEFDKNADIITLVQYNKQYSFIQAIKYLHSILNLTYKWQKKPVELPIKKLSNRFKKISREYKIDVNDIHTLNEDLLNDFIPIPYIGWVREGIMPWTVKRFGLAYSYRRKRVVIPHRYWLTGELVGLNMRTTVDGYDEFGIKKYWLTPSYQKSLNLYGLWENKEYITDAGYVVIAESEKSVLKRDSLNDRTVVALSGKAISQEQIRILIGLDVEIIVALDKDVNIQEMRHMCEHFYNKRNVSYIYDKYDLLKDKDAPMDANNKQYNFLLKYRIKYDESEHKKYLKELNNKR